MLRTELDGQTIHQIPTRKHHKARQKLQLEFSENKLFQELIDNIPDAVYFKDKEGHLVFVNKAHADGLHLIPEEVVGKTDHDFFPKEQADYMGKDDQKVMKTGTPIVDKVERTTRPDGSKHIVSTTKLPRKNNEGQIIGIMGITRDITDRTLKDEEYKRELKRTEEELRELNMALGNAMPGIARLDNNGYYIFMNETYARTMGYEPKELLGSNWQVTVHPDDHKHAINAYKEMINKGKGEFEAKGVCKNNSEFYKHVLMVKRCNEEGHFIGHHCFMRDITEKKKEQKHLRNTADNLIKEKTKLEQVLDIEEGLNTIFHRGKLVDFIVDRITAVLDAGRCSLMLYDEEGEELVIKGHRGLPKKIIQKYRIKKENSISGYIVQTRNAILVTNIETDHRFMKKNRSSYKSNSFISAPIILGDRLIGVINLANKRSKEGNIFTLLDLKILTMIARHVAIAMENATLYRELNYLTVTDPLTHMHNYRYFATSIDHEINRMKRYSESLCLMMIDVDDFKLYNDTYGHLEGNNLLKMMSATLTKNLRKVDIACRYAGDEFVVILPETSLLNATKVAEKIKKNFEILKLKRTMTLSIGLAECVNKMDRHELVLKADTALYDAKKEGKNKVRIL